MSLDKNELRALVRELLQRKGESATPADDAPLVSSGLLDSVDVLEIVAFLEQRCAIDFSTRPFDPTDFDTIDAIARLAA